MFREHLTVEAEPGGEAADGSGFAQLAPDVPPNSVRGVATVYPYHPESDCDPLFILYFVGEGDDVRIGARRAALTGHSFTTLFSAIDFSAASIIFCAVIASSSVDSGFCAHAAGSPPGSAAPRS